MFCLVDGSLTYDCFSWHFSTWSMICSIIAVPKCQMLHPTDDSKGFSFRRFENFSSHLNYLYIVSVFSIEPNLNRIFDNLHASYSSLEGKFKQEQFKVTFS